MLSQVQAESNLKPLQRPVVVSNQPPNQHVIPDIRPQDDHVRQASNKPNRLQAGSSSSREREHPGRGSLIKGDGVGLVVVRYKVLPDDSGHLDLLEARLSKELVELIPRKPVAGDAVKSDGLGCEWKDGKGWDVMLNMRAR